MATVPGYYLSNPAAIIYLPVIEAHEAALGEERGDIVIPTDGGKRWVYNQYKREIFKASYRVTDAQLAAFRTMHNTVQGQGLAFYFVTSDGVTLYVKKQQNFLYQRVRSGVNRYEVPLELSGEPTDAELSV